MAKSVIDIAIANIDADIASLQRSKEIILAAAASAPIEPAETKVWKPRKKKGLPADTGI